MFRNINKSFNKPSFTQDLDWRFMSKQKRHIFRQLNNDYIGTVF